MDAFARVVFRPGVLRNIDSVDISSTLLGQPIPSPLALAPTGFTRIVHPDGGPEVARAAAQPGIPYALSTLGTRSIEEVRAASDGRLLFQVGGGGDYPDDFAAARVPLSERGARLNESIGLLRRFRTAEPVDYSGRHFHYNGLRIHPPPAQPGCPPIVVTGWRIPAMPLSGVRGRVDALSVLGRAVHTVSGDHSGAG